MSPDSSFRLADHLAGSVSAARRRYRKRLARSRRNFSEAAVHKLRIETRRLLALLDLLEALPIGESPRKLRRTVKKRLDAFDELRDAQVQLALLRPLWADYPEAARLEKILARGEARLVSRLARKINTGKYTRLNRRLKQLEKGLRQPNGPSGVVSTGQASAVLREAFDQVAGLRRRVRADDTETIHRLRVAFKHFRYMAELLQPVLPRFSEQQLERMREYQVAAGDIQDLEVLLAGLATLVRGGRIPAAALFKLRRELSRRRRRAVTAFLEIIDDLLAFQPRPARAAGGTIRTLRK